jgi:hypothetical protein
VPRPKQGYKNAAGEKLPGIYDVTGRYEDDSALTRWKVGQAYDRGVVDGRNGTKTDEDRSAPEIGTAIHRMCELSLRGAKFDEIIAVPEKMLSVQEHRDQAWEAFGQFQDWLQRHHVVVISLEETIVCEALQFARTHDVIAWVDGRICKIDFKSCLAKNVGTVYLAQRIAMAAYGYCGIRSTWTSRSRLSSC